MFVSVLAVSFVQSPQYRMLFGRVCSGRHTNRAEWYCRVIGQQRPCFLEYSIDRWHVAETCNPLTANHAQLHGQRRADAPHGCEDALSSRQRHTNNRYLRARPTGLPRAMDGSDDYGRSRRRGILRWKELNRRFRTLELHRVSGTGTWNLDVTGLAV